MSQTNSALKTRRQLGRVRVRARGSAAVAFCLTLIVSDVGCVKLPHRAEVATANAVQTESDAAARVNINTAPRAELERLPGIGAGLAARIIEHRTRYGPFRRAEHLLIVPGISEHRFAQIRPLIRTE